MYVWLISLIYFRKNVNKHAIKVPYKGREVVFWILCKENLTSFQTFMNRNEVTSENQSSWDFRMFVFPGKFFQKGIMFRGHNKSPLLAQNNQRQRCHLEIAE